MGLTLILYPLAAIGALSLLFFGGVVRAWIKFKGELEAE